MELQFFIIKKFITLIFFNMMKFLFVQLWWNNLLDFPHASNYFFGNKLIILKDQTK
jgi:hypothetical protein